MGLVGFRTGSDLVVVECSDSYSLIVILCGLWPMGRLWAAYGPYGLLMVCLFTLMSIAAWLLSPGVYVRLAPYVHPCDGCDG